MIRASRIAVALALVCGTGATAQAADCVPLPTSVDGAPPATEVRLELREIVSLPPRTVVLAGAYHDAANVLQPALLASDDGGETWDTIPVPVGGAGLGHLETHGTGSLWGIVSFQQEGVDEPLYLMRSRDAGSTWCAISLAGLDALNGVDSFRMFDDRHGLLVFTEAPFGGDFSAYETRDGGGTWQHLWRADGMPPEAVDTAADYPDRALPDPPHATLWQREADWFAAHAVLRLRHDDGAFLIESYDLSRRDGWIQRSRIAGRYRDGDGELTPVP